MADPKIIKLIGRLYSKTVDGLVNWKKTAEEDVFAVFFSSYSLEISVKTEFDDDGDEFAVYRIRILNSTGDVVESIGPGSFVGNEYAISPYKIFELIFESARRHAMGLNVAVDSILQELDPVDSDDIPF